MKVNSLTFLENASICKEEAEVQAWIEQVTGEKFPPVRYEYALRDGIILCKLMNRLIPEVIKKVNNSGGDYKLIDNIQQFLRACNAYGITAVDTFK